MRPRESTSVMYCSFAKGCEPMNLEERILELSRCGYACGQILAILLMETISEENLGFVRCMQDSTAALAAAAIFAAVCRRAAA